MAIRTTVCSLFWGGLCLINLGEFPLHAASYCVDLRNTVPIESTLLSTNSIEYERFDVETASGGGGSGEDCFVAIPVSDGSYGGSTTGQPSDGGPSPSCGNPSAFADWYAYFPSCTGIATAQTCNGAIDDTVLAVFDSCAGPQITCSDDDCPGDAPPSGPGFLSTVSWSVSSSSVYYIRVSGWGISTLVSSYTLDLFCGAPPVCGNGIQEAGEECDDANTMNGDGCSSNCLVEAAVCGNGVVEAGEQCDDFNPLGGDGCDAACQIEYPATYCADTCPGLPQECQNSFFGGQDSDAFASKGIFKVTLSPTLGGSTMVIKTQDPNTLVLRSDNHSAGSGGEPSGMLGFTNPGTSSSDIGFHPPGFNQSSGVIPSSWGRRN